MKKVILSSALLFTILLSYSQNYSPFLQNIGWCIEIYAGTGYAMQAYTKEGDTTIGAFSYSKLFKNPDQFLVREDTILRKVWVILPDSTNETLLYDFNISIGSQIELSYIGAASVAYNVESIDSINTPLGSRKRITLSTNDTSYSQHLYWIEGVGSTYSPIYLNDPTYSWYEGHCLVCSYKDIGLQSFLGSCSLYCMAQPGDPCYSFIVGLEELNTEISIIIAIETWPNKILVKSSTSDKIQSVRMIAINGKILKEIHGLSNSTIEIGIDRYPMGFYILETMMENGKIITKKFTL